MSRGAGTVVAATERQAVLPATDAEAGAVEIMNRGVAQGIGHRHRVEARHRVLIGQGPGILRAHHRPVVISPLPGLRHRVTVGGEHLLLRDCVGGASVLRAVEVRIL